MQYFLSKYYLNMKCKWSFEKKRLYCSLDSWPLPPHIVSKHAKLRLKIDVFRDVAQKSTSHILLECCNNLLPHCISKTVIVISATVIEEFSTTVCWIVAIHVFTFESSVTLRRIPSLTKTIFSCFPFLYSSWYLK